ncbi:hypothetical protein VM95_10250 [Streptomyces rubellomurinus]|uniref:Uncharacterized protein n=1 Tax=Streptomyces rubellomurinus (strain ATCC 31215) TaxID=359131 RepID=A0A0F2TG67_STRR3|nr:hypothetical protein VM95_10250 [Streptomyces rubellomurinus]
MFALVDRVRWRRVLETTGIGTPAAVAKLAVRWRRSCRAMRGTPALSQSRWKRSRTCLGCRGRPWRWKT